MATVQDLILTELKEIRSAQKLMGEDLAVLNSKHDNGNKSEKIAAYSAVVAVIISIVAVSAACGATKGSKKYEKNIYDGRYIGGNPGSVSRKVRPKKEPVSDQGINPESRAALLDERKAD